MRHQTASSSAQSSTSTAAVDLDIETPNTPSGHTKLSILYTAEGKAIADWLRKHAVGADVIGFDTETRPQFVKGGGRNRIALLQLATFQNAVLLLPTFQLSPTDWDVVRPLLEDILRNPSTRKVGVAVAQDLSMFVNDWYLDVDLSRNCGCVDLLKLAKQHKIPAHPTGAEPLRFGLKSLAERYLGIFMGKGPSTANWEMFPMSETMRKYAALDAWFGAAVFDALAGLMPPRDFQAHLRSVEKTRPTKIAKLKSNGPKFNDSKLKEPKSKELKSKEPKSKNGLLNGIISGRPRDNKDRA
ncbi:hypothetical protein HKX48_007577 [Thoreauomyces humboldtii]|nr:hypothetical protein HKX48_007577 [Thoreauomyces humboldtii]